MAKPIIDNLSDEEKAQLAEASAEVKIAADALSAATRRRHALWKRLSDQGHSHADIARASGVIRQAVGLAIRSGRLSE